MVVGDSIVVFGNEDEEESYEERIIAAVGLNDEADDNGGIDFGSFSDRSSSLFKESMRRESVRKAVASGTKIMKDYGVERIGIDCCGDPEAAAEGSFLAGFSFDHLKTEKEKAPSSGSGRKPKTCKVVSPTPWNSKGEEDDLLWKRGEICAKAQNLARFLTEHPANMMTPQYFATSAREALLEQKTNSDERRMKVQVREMDWIKEMKMGAFLSVSQGSPLPPVFLEITYNFEEGTTNGADTVLVGKGVTFDSGGISIKPSAGMSDMKRDMAGAATVIGTISGLASLHQQKQLPKDFSVIGLVPLCENMPSGTATRPGDVVTAMSGHTIEIVNTDAEGRLLLADALNYSQRYCSKGDIKKTLVVDVATLTGAIGISLGQVASGAFVSNDDDWKLLEEASYFTGERSWRMPLFPEYLESLKSKVADLKNAGGRLGGSSSAALFLRNFIPKYRWIHLDIAGVDTGVKSPYHPEGSTGIPVRTLIHFLRLLQKA